MAIDRLSSSDLDRQADEILADDLRAELCRECEARGVSFGTALELTVLDKHGADTGLRAVVEQFVCEQGHVWHAGEGRARGRGGESPILLDEHYAYRRSKEAYMASGTVDEWTKPGMFHREHVEK